MKHSWIFRPWYVFRLRQQLSSPFKMKNEVEAIRANCILQIEQAVEPLLLSLKKLAFQIGIKEIQNNRSRLERRKFQKPLISPNPLFSQREITNIIRKFWIGIVILIVFTASEGALYLLTASLFVPGGSEILKLSVAVFLALLSLFCLDYGFEQHFKYREIKSLLSRSGEYAHELRMQNDKRILGYILIGLALMAILFAGLARIYYLENVDVSGLSEGKMQSVRRASKWASWLTLIVTLASAILLAVIKREQSKTAEQYQVYRYWNRAQKRRNQQLKTLINDANKILLRSETIFEKSFQLVIDLKRVFRMEQEFDAKYEQLNQEYLDMKARPGFTLSEHVYRRFSPIQGAHEELFKYGITTSPEIKPKLAFALELQRMAEEYLEEHKNGIYQQGANTEDPNPSMNGKQYTKETNFQNS